MPFEITAAPTHEELIVPFVPDIGDNRDNLEDPFRVGIHPIDATTHKNRQTAAYARVRKADETVIATEKLTRKTFVGGVKWVEGCPFRNEKGEPLKLSGGRVVRPGEVVQIETGAELWDACHASQNAAHLQIINQIYSAITDLSVLDEGDLGKLRSRSGFSPAAKSPSNGVAGDAEAADTETPTVSTTRSTGGFETATAGTLSPVSVSTSSRG